MDPLDLYSLGRIGPIMRREQIERAAEDRLGRAGCGPGPSTFCPPARRLLGLVAQLLEDGDLEIRRRQESDVERLPPTSNETRGRGPT